MEQVCQIFDFPPTDDFCLNPSEQQWNTLEAALKRRFPVGQATFSQVMNNLEVTYTDFSKDPKKFRYDAILATFQEFAGANCPGTSDTADFYTCDIYFKHDILLITVHFEPTTNVVLRMGVWHPGT